jgi:hypothetical protein
MKLWILPLLLVLMTAPALASDYTDLQHTAEGFYTFDNQDVGDSIYDDSLNGRNATGNNTIWDNNTAEPSKIGIYKEFNRTGAKIIVPDSVTSLMNPTTGFSISAWYKSANTGNNEYFFYYGNDTDSLLEIYYKDIGTEAQICMANTYGMQRCISSPDPFPFPGQNGVNPGDGEWNFVTVTFKFGSSNTYISVNEWATYGSGVIPPNTGIPTEAKIYIGHKPGDTTNSSPGAVKAFGFFNTFYEYPESETWHNTLWNGGNAYDPCIEEWICDAYDTPTCLINDTSTASCISVYDNASCGTTYTGDYTEFANQTGTCDYCTPEWLCTGYETCVSPATTASCDTVNDNNTCYSITNLTSDQYDGNYTEFNTTSCSYGGGGGGGSFPETTTEENTTQTPLLAVANTGTTAFDLQASINSITGLFSADTTTEEIIDVAKKNWILLIILLLVTTITIKKLNKKGKRKKR